MFTGLLETETELTEILLRLVLASLFGGMIGFEREVKNRPAGLRTNMMVALTAATLTLISAELISESTERADMITIDTLRVIEAVVAGVAFLGAGTIIRGGEGVQGLTTAASLWMSAAIGLACGGGFYLLAGTALALAVAILYLIKLLERRIGSGEES